MSDDEEYGREEYEKSLEDDMKTQFWTVTLHRIDETNGCIMDDGCDTRTGNTEFHFIPDSEKEGDRFGEFLVGLWECQDYSYQVSHKELFKFNWDDMLKLRKALKRLEKEYPRLFEDGDNND
jgi:hypothetical protein